MENAAALAAFCVDGMLPMLLHFAMLLLLFLRAATRVCDMDKGIVKYNT